MIYETASWKTNEMAFLSPYRNKYFPVELFPRGGALIWRSIIFLFVAYSMKNVSYVAEMLILN